MTDAPYTPQVPRAPREVYLDYAAATPVAPEVIEAMLPYFTELFENPSAPYARARAVRASYEQARTTLAHLIGAKPGNVTITAGATEANNLALATVTGPLITAATEHESVLATVQARGGQLLPVSSEGLVSASTLEAALTPETELVSVALANGEVGAVQPIRELAAVVAKERDRRLAAGEKTPLYLHTDASQAAATRTVDVSQLRADLVTLSAAKVYGPKQVGLVWAADGVCLRPLVLGGGQEGGVRSGTENVAGAVGFARALELASAGRAKEPKRLEKLRNGLLRALTGEFSWLQVSGPRNPKNRLSGLLHISFPGLDARRLVVLLERRGVSVGTGSACAASKMRVSHVLEAMGVSEAAARGSLRISLGRPTTEDDVRCAGEAIAAVVREECARLGLDARTGEPA